MKKLHSLMRVSGDVQLKSADDSDTILAQVTPEGISILAYKLSESDAKALADWIHSLLEETP